MFCLFELSKNHYSLPISEVISVLNAENVYYDIIESNLDVLLIGANLENKFLNRIVKRLSYTFFVDEFLFSCSADFNEIKNNAKKISIKKSGSVAVRCKNRLKKVDSQKIIKLLAEIYTRDRRVNLTNPDIEIRVLITDKKVYVGIKRFEIDKSDFEKRKVQFRPFFSPITLHPKLARALVNLSEVSKNEVLLDPFCGTGGILLEAGLIGVNVIGSDIENKMIDGCKKTLDYYNIKNYDLYCSDIGKIDQFVKNVDAVVTDLPYGRSTTTKGEDMSQLYQRTFQMINKVLKNGSKAVIGLPNKQSIHQAQEYLTLLKTHEIRAHRSLTRYFSVFEKEP